MSIFADVTGFEWDAGNKDKNLIKHRVSTDECEEAFADERKLVREDSTHSQHEQRYYTVGSTKQNRLLFIVFTLRKDKIRAISARDVNKKERTYYENQ